MPRTRHLSIYRYYPLGNRYGFSISVQPEITPLFIFLRLKKFFKSSQVCDWLAKLIMVGFMVLQRPRVVRRSNVGLVLIYIIFNPSLAWIRGHWPCTVWNEICNPFTKFSGSSYFVSLSIMDVITFPCWDKANIPELEIQQFILFIYLC